MTSPSKANANRRNAKRSTGPRSAAGKARSSSNALNHGVLSRHLLLPDEDPAEWAALLGRLLDELSPVGTLEQTLVERIAVALWRQRRVIMAETARIRLAQAPGASERFRLKGLLGDNPKLVEQVLSGDGEADDRLLYEDLLHAVAASVTDLDVLRVEYPRVWRNLLAIANPAGGVALYLAKRHQGKVADYLAALLATLKQIVAAHDYMGIQKDAGSLPVAPELMARYQAALDNDLYKAMRALRDAQRFRREVIDAEVTPVDDPAGE